MALDEKFIGFLVSTNINTNLMQHPYLYTQFVSNKKYRFSGVQDPRKSRAYKNLLTKHAIYVIIKIHQNF